jgi:XTP/dITP diphosphohydrolase
MNLVLATHNKDKVAEISRILAGLDIELSTLDDYPGAPEPVEDGETLEANALKKAVVIREFTGRSALADDTGLFVDALDGAPGIHAARFASGQEQGNAGYIENYEKLLEAMRDVDDAVRTATFHTVMAVALSQEDAGWVQDTIDSNPDKVFGVRLDDRRIADTLVTEGFLHGTISREPLGEHGFGYDPVFCVPQYKRTLAEMTAGEKNSLSHRYRALVEMRALLIRLDLAEESPRG